MAGTCYCEFLDGARLDLHPGDLILLPRGTPHLLRSDSPAQPCEPTVERRGSIPLYQLNGPGEALDMLCGSYRYHAGASLFGALPERLLVHMDESTQQPLRALIGLMREEAESTRSGAARSSTRWPPRCSPWPCAPTWTANRWATACSACWATPAWDEPCGPCWNARSMPGPWNSLPSRRRCRGPVSSAPSPPSADLAVEPADPHPHGKGPRPAATNAEEPAGYRRRDRLPVGGGVFPISARPSANRRAVSAARPTPLAESATGAHFGDPLLCNVNDFRNILYEFTDSTATLCFPGKEARGTCRGTHSPALPVRPGGKHGMVSEMREGTLLRLQRACPSQNTGCSPW